MSGSNLHSAWAQLFLHAAACAGVRDVVLSPGSRSTPLALAAGQSSELRCHGIVDERSAAFFALGQARVSGRPSMLICTSGTAGAHYYPAVIEASESRLPLVVVTADRPWELQDLAAPQTIDQRRLFGAHVRHFAELGLPDPSRGALEAVARIAAQAVALSAGPLPGPVHVNAHFRKPLEPVAAAAPEAWEPAVRALLQRGPTRVYAPRQVVDETAVAELSACCEQAERGLIVCGPAPLAAAASRVAVGDLARATGFPVLAEAVSQLRFGELGEGVVRLGSFDALFRAPAFRERHAPDFILELGSPPISAGYASLLAGHPAGRRVVVAPHGWNDPAGGATALVLGDAVDVVARVASRLSPLPPSRKPSLWAQVLAGADAAALALAAGELAGDALTEGAVARAVVDACPPGSLLAVGNSCPVRDLDTWCPPSSRPLSVVHQRGASGIDGLVSGAAGARSVAGRAVTLLLGDLSLLHDLTGLGLLRGPGPPCVVVVVENGGGRIFDQLPIGARALAPGAPGEAVALFERLFAMPQPLDRAHAAAAFGLPFARVATVTALRAALAAAHARGGATLFEAVVPPRDGALRVARHWDAVRALVAATASRGAPDPDHLPEGVAS